MEPTVRSPWIESAIITDRVQNVAFGLPNPKNAREATGIWPSKTLPRGTEFLDAETGGQKSALETTDVHRDGKSGTIPTKISTERPIRSRRDGRMEPAVRSPRV